MYGDARLSINVQVLPRKLPDLESSCLTRPRNSWISLLLSSPPNITLLLQGSGRPPLPPDLAPTPTTWGEMEVWRGVSEVRGRCGGGCLEGMGALPLTLNIASNTRVVFVNTNNRPEINMVGPRNDGHPLRSGWLIPPVFSFPITGASPMVTYMKPTLECHTQTQ